MLPNSEKDFLYYESYTVALKLIEAIRERNVDDFSVTVEQLGEAAKRLKKDAVANIINQNHWFMSEFNELTVQNFLEYLHSQYPATRGNILLRDFDRKLQELNACARSAQRILLTAEDLIDQIIDKTGD